ncbi:hypothetical protein DV736_g76, partial [Chaetothyriales sp. CBS 134916]
LANAADTQVPIRIRLVTKDSRYGLPESGPILVPSSFRRLALSSLVNGLLGHDTPVPFDFIIRGSYLRSSLEDVLSAHGISSETIVDAEYTPAQKAPQYVCSFEHDDWVSAVDTWSSSTATHDQPRILSASYDGRIRVWDSSSQVLATSPAQGQGGHWSFVKDAKYVSSCQIVSAGFDRVVRVWKYQEAADGLSADITPELELHGHSACIDAVDVHPASHRILTASADHSIGLWSARKSDAPALSEEDVAVKAVRESGKRRKLKAAGSVAQRGPLSVLQHHTQQVSGAVFDLKDATVAYSTSWDQTMRTWDLVTSSVVDTRVTNQALFAVEQVPELQLVATGTAGREIKLIDPRTSASVVTAMTLKGHRNAVVGLARDPGSSHRLASASHDGSCRVWDLRFTKQGQEGITSQSLYTLGRQSLHGKAQPEAGVGAQVYGVCWDRELGILSCGQDKCIQLDGSHQA